MFVRGVSHGHSRRRQHFRRARPATTAYLTDNGHAAATGRCPDRQQRPCSSIGKRSLPANREEAWFLDGDAFKTYPTHRRILAGRSQQQGISDERPDNFYARPPEPFEEDQPAGRSGLSARREAIIASKAPTLRRGRKTAEAVETPKLASVSEDGPSSVFEVDVASASDATAGAAAAAAAAEPAAAPSQARPMSTPEFQPKSSSPSMILRKVRLSRRRL